MTSTPFRRLNLTLPRAMVLALALIHACAWAAADDQARLDEVIKDLKQAQSALEKQQTKKSRNEQALRKSEIELGRISADLRRINSELRKISREIDSLEREKRQLQANIDSQQSALRKDIINSYSTGRQEYFKVLLNQEDPAKMARLITYYNYFHQARNTRIETFQNSLMALDSLNRELEQKHQDTETKKKQLVERQASIAREKDKRARIIKALNGEITTQEQRISRLDSARKQLEDIILRVGDIMAEITSKLGGESFKANKGKFLLPAKGKVVSKYRSRRAQGKLRSNGVIIGAPQGADVNTIYHGRVVFSDWLRGFGLLTIIDHGDGYMTLYGNNETLLKDTGDWVSAGDIIATAGNSGGQDSPGLYFEIRQHGKPTNPLAWCKTR